MSVLLTMYQVTSRSEKLSTKECCMVVNLLVYETRQLFVDGVGDGG